MKLKAASAILDLETNIRNTPGLSDYVIGNFGGDPFHPDNGIVLGLYIVGEDKTYLTSADKAADVFNHRTIVGHNLKFDLLYMRKFWPDQYREWVKSGGLPWDTMVVEYLLTGQENKMMSLDRASAKYGGTQKDDRIKEYWNSGIDTPDIPVDELTEYLDHDVLNTQIVYEAQRKQVMDAGILALVRVQMRALLAVTEAQHNGMYFDTQLAAERAAIYVEAKAQSMAFIKDRMLKKFPDNMVSELNPVSPSQISKFFYGGDVKVRVDIPMLDDDGNEIIFKSGLKKGKVRTKKSIEIVTLEPIVKPRGEPNAHGAYATSEDVIEKLSKYFTEKKQDDLAAVCKHLLLVRNYTKQIGTYYVGYSSLVWNDQCIHPNFNLALTDTGRLSCSSPNLQNVSAKGVNDD